jgi:haloacetate dehalogenase
VGAESLTSTTHQIDTGETTIFADCAGSGPPLLLLHGFPQTHIMWRFVVAQLADTFTVVCADLRGYGRSGCPPSAPDHAPYSKRAIARDMATVMEKLGHRDFAVCGHDRGGRVAYRLALDFPERVSKLAVLDILPIETAWHHADARFALGYWPWSLLAQPAPLPEQILTTNAAAIVDNALSEWGSPGEGFPIEVRNDYVEALADPAHAHAICEEYRAAATIDREHDRADRKDGRRIQCPVLVLWAAEGPLDQWYADQGGPLGLWKDWANPVEGCAVEGGHFFPEASSSQTAMRLRRFFSQTIQQGGR